MKIHQLQTLLPQLHKALEQRGKHIVISESYKIPVNQNNFYEIPDITKINETDKADGENASKKSNTSNQAKIVFIDGGNAEVIGGVNFSLQLIRTASTVYQENKQIQHKREECFCLTTTVPRKGQLFFETKLTPRVTEIPTYKLNDKTLAPQGRTPPVSLIPEITRRFLELICATRLLEHLSEGDSIILDGLISPHYTGETILVEQLLTKAREKNIAVIGFAKTSRLMTESASSAMDALREYSPGGCWRYSSPLTGSLSRASLSTHFVRLHAQSKHVFRIQVPDFCKDQVDHVLSLLMNNSSDPIFLGYPYGLIATDRFARVSNREKEYLKIALQSLAGKGYKSLAQSMNALNAHEILDTM